MMKKLRRQDLVEEMMKLTGVEVGPAAKELGA
jgi:hypothetical protein